MYIQASELGLALMLKVTISDRNDYDNNINDYSDDSEKSNNK